MLLLKRKTFEVESSGAVVTGDEAGAVATAEEIVAAAQAEAAHIHEEAVKDAAAERKRGYQDGIDEGKMEILMQKLNLVEESVGYMESIEGKISELVMKALRKCVAEIGDQELVCQIVKKAMQAVVRNQRQITVKVNPAMVPVVKTRLQAILAEFPALSYADVAEDPHLEATACVVETEAGIVEASIDGQLKAIEKSIRRNFSREEK